MNNLEVNNVRMVYGNVMVRHPGSQDKVLFADEPLAYDPKADTYQVLAQTFGPTVSLTLERDKLTLLEIEKLNNIVCMYTLKSDIPNTDGSMYIDGASITDEEEFIRKRNI